MAKNDKFCLALHRVKMHDLSPDVKILLLSLSVLVGGVESVAGILIVWTNDNNVKALLSTYSMFRRNKIRSKVHKSLHLNNKNKIVCLNSANIYRLLHYVHIFMHK
jgi:hypothetical protein